MKILLTGAKGQVGQEVLALASAGTFEVYPYSKAELDITQEAQIENAIQACRPSVLINAAAYTAVDKAEQEIEKAYAINRDGVGHLARACKRHNLPIIHLSTDYVFNGSKTTAYREEDVPVPQNVYGASKAAGELLLQKEWEKHLIFRTSWVFGLQGPNFVKTILRLALKQTELRVVSDQKGCPTAAADLASALVQVAAMLHQGKTPWGLFHYCGDQETTWFEFAKCIVHYGKACFPLKLEKLHAITTAEYPTPAKRPQNSVLNTEKIQQTYGLKPPSWEQALVRMIQGLEQTGELREHFST